MEKDMVIQGRTVTPFDINHIKQSLADNPSWNRTKLSRVLCEKWHWFRPGGQQPKDMACRSLLLKLERAGYIELPPRCAPSVNGLRKSCLAPVPHLTGEICCSLKTLFPPEDYSSNPRIRQSLLIQLSSFTIPLSRISNHGR